MPREDMNIVAAVGKKKIQGRTSIAGSSIEHEAQERSL
jgi:hypothetical protein